MLVGLLGYLRWKSINLIVFAGIFNCFPFGKLLMKLPAAQHTGNMLLGFSVRENILLLSVFFGKFKVTSHKHLFVLFFS